MILSRELGKRIWGGSTNMENGGGGVSSDAIAGLLTGYAKESWVDEHYISIDFFSRLFQAHGTENGSEIDVIPNDMDTTITSVESMFGFWTNLYISALGSNGAAPAGISLGMLTDVTITGTPSAGQVLTFDAVSGMWVNGNAQAGATALANLTDVTLSTPQANQVMIYDATTQKWMNSSLKTINGNSIFGTGDIPASGGASGNYLPLSGGTLAGSNPLLILQTNSSESSIQYKPYNLGAYWATGAGSWGVPGFAIGYFDKNGSPNNACVLALTNDGNVGIGTTSPSSLLTVNSQATTTQILSTFIEPNLNTANYNVIGLGRDASSCNIGFLEFYYNGNNSSTNFLSLGFYGKDFIFNVLANGNVGIGTTSPSVPLTIHSENTETVLFSLFEQPNIRAGYNNAIAIGKNVEPYNSAILEFFYRGNNNPSNLVSLGLAGADYLLNVTGAGNVGIGTMTPSYTLHVAGTIYATGAITALSDARKKDITGEAGVTVEQIAHAPAVQFLWKDAERRKDGQQVGTLAQYWQTVLPEVVMDKGGELSMQYGVAALVSAIVTARKVVDHERRITELEKENERLQKEVEQLRLN